MLAKLYHFEKHRYREAYTDVTEHKRRPKRFVYAIETHTRISVVPYKTCRAIAQ